MGSLEDTLHEFRWLRVQVPLSPLWSQQAFASLLFQDNLLFV